MRGGRKYRPGWMRLLMRRTIPVRSGKVVASGPSAMGLDIGTEELRKRATNKIAEIDLRIAQLQTMRTELAAVIDAECDSLTDCSCGLGRTLPFVELDEVRAPRRAI